MGEKIRSVEYYYVIVDDKPGEGSRLLKALRTHGVNLLASIGFPVGEGRAQLDFFPEDGELLKKAAASEGVILVGPKKAFLIQGDDRIGALVKHHEKLSDAGINVHAAHGMSDGRGGYGYILWVKPEDYGRAAQALEI
ncbi:MAG: hypothetical protein JSV44_00655 [Candidatus Zixiibacteriota bacterium]|nr:MAG: hypothetical protein JSV44_00655 [candidate division Zixibacteria bacterium]